MLNLPQEVEDQQVRAEASRYLAQCLPVLIRFMADEFDDTCSTVFPLLQAILTNVCSGSCY